MRSVGRWSLLVAAFLAMGCGRTGWNDPGLRVVDGQYVVGERPCPASDAAACSAIGSAAEAALRSEAVSVRAISIADLPIDWRDATGQQVLHTFGGLGQTEIAVVDLADGSRRAIVLYCIGPIRDDDGEIVSEMQCESSQADTYAVGGGFSD